MKKTDAYQVLWKTRDGRLRLKRHRAGEAILMPPGEGFEFRGVTALVLDEDPVYLNRYAQAFGSAALGVAN